MQVLVIGEDAGVETALAARGLELVCDTLDTDALVTLAPRTELRPVAELDPAAWQRIFSAFAEEPFFSAQPWLQAACDRGSGTWVAVTTTLATQPFPGGIAGVPALALQTLVRIAALEGVRANAVAAGWREDRFPDPLDRDLAVADSPGRRLASAEDVAAAVAWLLSDDSSHVNGEVLRVDGGYTITRGSRPDPGKE